jgi:hypothetical protein
MPIHNSLRFWEYSPGRIIEGGAVSRRTVTGDRQGMTERPRTIALAIDIAATGAGLTMVATPLALWASPNLTAFYAVLGSCAAAYLLLVLLGWLDPSGSDTEAS